MSTNHPEIPDTQFGLNQYVRYCKKQIKENKNQIKRLNIRIGWCMDKAESLGFIIDINGGDE